MIGFAPPVYHPVAMGVSMAVFTVSDTPGSQYEYRNRDLDWLRDLMSQYAYADLSAHACTVNFDQRPSPGHLRSPEALARWWIGSTDIHPFSANKAGAVLRLFERQYPKKGERFTYRMPGDLFVYVLIKDGDRACPLRQYWYHGVPRKNRRRRKWEVRGKGEWVERTRRRWSSALPRESTPYINLWSPTSEATRRFREAMDPNRG